MRADDLLITEGRSLTDALRQLDETAMRCLFVIDDFGKLVGSLTDGDVRRLILGKGSLEGTVGDACNRSPKVASQADRMTPQRVASLGVTAVPVIDGEGRVTDVVFADGTTLARKASLDEPIPVVMMAGGKGTRLLPLTAIIPKPLVPVEGTTIAERIIGRFHDAGCDDFWLVINYKRGMIRAYFDELSPDYDVHLVEEDEFRGTGGGLKLLEGKVGGTFILTNCDILVDMDLGALVRTHHEAGNAATAVVSLRTYTIPYGTVEIGEGGGIVGMTEKPTFSALVYTGVCVLEPEALALIGEDEYLDFPDLLMRLRDAGMGVGVFPVGEGAWLDMGQLDELRRMNSVLGGES